MVGVALAGAGLLVALTSGEGLLVLDPEVTVAKVGPAEVEGEGAIPAAAAALGSGVSPLRLARISATFLFSVEYVNPIINLNNYHK